jgi:hypothetical protein
LGSIPINNKITTFITTNHDLNTPRGDANLPSGDANVKENVSVELSVQSSGDITFLFVMIKLVTDNGHSLA